MREARFATEEKESHPLRHDNFLSERPVALRTTGRPDYIRKLSWQPFIKTRFNGFL